MAFSNEIRTLLLRNIGHAIEQDSWVSYFLRDQSLIRGREGGYKTGGGGQVKFYPYKNGVGAAKKVLAMLRGGTKSFEIRLMPDN